jgi:glycosyltransferase involved in cell wall biosynthesis
MNAPMLRTLAGSEGSGRVESIRVLPELRAVQVERDRHMTPSRTLYLGEKYDLGATPLPERMRKSSLAGAAISLYLARESVLELPEPLWLRFLPRQAILVLAWKAGGLIRSRPRETVTYALENNDLNGVLFGNRRPIPAVTALFRIVFRAYVSLTFNRIAFGSAGASETYGALRLASRVKTRQWDELPAAAAPTSTPSRISEGAIFIGRLEERKGLRRLFEAWGHVERRLPNAKLTVVGGGELAAEVHDWCSARPSSREWIGEVEHDEISRLVAENQVLVAPSIRWGRWREQIGLPIGEALQAGLTVVTTDETGLATWLAANGHYVVPAGSAHEQLSQSLTSALSHPNSPDDVKSSLPQFAGRLAADRWLHNPGVAS